MLGEGWVGLGEGWVGPELGTVKRRSNNWDQPTNKRSSFYLFIYHLIFDLVSMDVCRCLLSVVVCCYGIFITFLGKPTR